MRRLDTTGTGAAHRHFAWVGGACLIGFLLSFVTVRYAALARDWFVLAHVVVTGAFLASYARNVSFWPRALLWRWKLGLVLGAVAAAFSVSFVLSQPPSAGPEGARLILSTVWLGLVYGVLDALLLTVLPVFSVWEIARAGAWSERRWGWTAAALAALAASLAVTVAYHLGFPEFQGPQILQPMIGNAVITLAYIFSRSPLAPIVAHVALHTAAVVHSFQTSVPLPPHY